MIAQATMGSLFDGIGGFPLAAVRHGIQPVWASEIETFPIEVTKVRFPNMLHVGDITKLDGATLPPVDIVCGGSPCQDLSVAGNRAGLAGERSGLFMEQTRIAKEMRETDERRGISARLVRPRFFMWENVLGAFSSAGGEDFRSVLEEVVRIKHSTAHVPRPDGGRFEPAGAIILGDKFSLAWRVLDAQYWGVAQRRRRIFLVADFGGLAAPEILFKQDCMSWDTASGRGAWQGATAAATRCTDNSGRAVAPPMLCLNDQGGDRMDITEEVTATLRAQMGGHQPLVMATQQGSAEIGVGICPTITAIAGMSGNNQPVLFDGHGQDARYNGPLSTAPTVVSAYGEGGGNIPLALNPAIAFSLDAKESNSMKSANRYSGCRRVDISRTLDTTYPDPSKNQGGIAILQESYCIAGNVIDRQPQNGGNGLGCQAEMAYTLTGADRHAVCAPYQNVVGSLCHGDEKGISNQYVGQDKCIIQPSDVAVFGQSQFGSYRQGCTTLRAKGGDNGGGSENLVAVSSASTTKLIRRLTPLECERLQGFPDGWTKIPKASDSARYKALGNSVAIPCVEFLMQRVACFLSQDKEEEACTSTPTT